MATTALKLAVTVAAAVRVTMHGPVPEQLPPQLPKEELAPAVEVSVTFVFCGKVAEHVVGQLIPAGLLVTVPVPVPDMVTVKPSPAVVAVKVSLTVTAAVIVRLHVMPEQPPLKPPKV